MEPTDLTCAKCGTGWKLIKAGDGPLTCPNCKAVIGPGSPEAGVPAGADAVRANDSGTPSPAAVDPPPRPAAEISDADDPGIGQGPRARLPAFGQPRRGRHPLVTIAVILLLLLLVPLTLVACLFAVCAFALRSGG